MILSTIYAPTEHICEVDMQDEQKITEVHSCTDCSRVCNPDGTFNTVGFIHRQSLTRWFGNSAYLDCLHCPVTQKMSAEELAEVLRDIDGTE